jgi:hypothetical protein
MYVQNTHSFLCFKLTFDLLQFNSIEELTNEIDVWFQEINLIYDAGLHLKPRLPGHKYLVGSLIQGSYISIFITYS